MKKKSLIIALVMCFMLCIIPTKALTDSRIGTDVVRSTTIEYVKRNHVIIDPVKPGDAIVNPGNNSSNSLGGVITGDKTKMLGYSLCFISSFSLIAILILMNDDKKKKTDKNIATI